MKTSLDCISCFVRQSLEAARYVTDDVAVHERIVRDVLLMTAELDFAQSPPGVGQRIHQHLREITNVEDPYRAIKDRSNYIALDMLPELSAMVEASADPLAPAVRLAIAGNMIDLGVKGEITEDDVREGIAQTFSEPFHGDLDGFREAVECAESILYLTDNAGEIVFDRLLIERLPVERTTVVVRGGAVINDATMIDAEAAGLREIVEVIDNGFDAPGTILEDCSLEFRKRFAEADLIISKGQGNYESLSEEQGNIIFLLKVKCPVIAAHIELPIGTHVLTRLKSRKL